MSRVSRRGILSGTAALVSPVGMGASLPPAEPDAELIARCRAYIAATVAYDAEGGWLVDEGQDPHWRRMKAARDAIRGLHATTLAGLAAKAEVARFEARQLDGSEDYDTCHTGDWPEQVIRDLLRMTGAGT